MSEPQKPEDNPYLATQVADIAGAADDRKSPGPVAIIFAILLGATTAVVTFCLTFFFTCLGMTGPGGSTGEIVFPISLLVGAVTAIALTWFAVWGFLKIVKALKN